MLNATDENVAKCIICLFILFVSCFFVCLFVVCCFVFLNIL